MDKTYKMPAIVWLKMTDYMHGWLQHELGGGMRVKDKQVLSIQHLEGAREVMRMETSVDMVTKEPVDKSMSATWKNCIEAGMDLDPEAVKNMYGMDKDIMKLFVPIECPKNCLTINGVLRPWGLDVNLGRQQATALQNLLRNEFWKAVEEYNVEYARRMEGKEYPAIKMIEAFCAETKTSDEYAAAMRREWQRRQKRGGENAEEK